MCIQNNNIHTSFDSESSAASFFFPPPNCTHRNDAQLPHTITTLKAWEWWGLEYTSKVTLHELLSYDALPVWLAMTEHWTGPANRALHPHPGLAGSVYMNNMSILISSTFVYNTCIYIMLQGWCWIINGWTFCQYFSFLIYFSVWLQWKSLKLLACKYFFTIIQYSCKLAKGLNVMIKVSCLVYKHNIRLM